MAIGRLLLNMHSAQLIGHERSVQRSYTLINHCEYTALSQASEKVHEIEGHILW